ncbi:hypothetical protein [Kitasatospora herbaricolor]|uniref:hypothetical protein n=1 Tax=Kitasatospora herbaricolor TaxID=68217 RepID=UPI00268CFFA9
MSGADDDAPVMNDGFVPPPAEGTGRARSSRKQQAEQGVRPAPGEEPPEEGRDV